MSTEVQTAPPPDSLGPYEVVIVRDCRIPVAGGALAADVYLPVDAPPAPAVVSLVPYGKDGLAGVGAWQANHYFASHGFPTVIADFRGLGNSTGDYRPPFAPEEVEDGLALVAWAAEQTWCDGDVGMWGVSYGAIITLRTAAAAPTSLKAIVPIIGCPDPERDFIHPNGNHGFMSSLGMWGLTMFLMQLMPSLHDIANPARVAQWQRRLEADEPHLFDLLRRRPGDPVWRERAVDVTRITAPSLCVAGWHDLFCDGSIRAYEALCSPKQLLVGPWMHSVPQEAESHPVDFLPVMLAWWNRWLGSGGEPVDPSVTADVFIERDGWQRFPTWPPPTEPMRLYPDASGNLGSEAGPPSALRHDGIAVSGVTAGLRAFPSGFGRPTDQGPDDARSLTFTTRPLDTSLTICGRASLHICGPAEIGRITARLCDVAPDGSSELICVATSDGASSGDTVDMPFEPAGYRVASGHRLRLALGTDDFPRLLPQDGKRQLAVLVGDDAAFLELPVLRSPGTGFDPDAPAARGPLPLRAPSRPQLEVAADDETATVAVVDDVVMSTTDERSTVAYRTRVSATVKAAGGAHVGGDAEIRVTGPLGREIAIQAELTLTSDAATLAAVVAVDGAPHFRRRWKLDLQ